MGIFLIRGLVVGTGGVLVVSGGVLIILLYPTVLVTKTLFKDIIGFFAEPAKKSKFKKK
jgi:hypothetical protein